MATSAFLGGITFSQEDTPAGSTYSDIEEATGLSGLGAISGLVETTHFASTAREYIAGLADGSEIGLTCNYLPAGTEQGKLKTYCDNGDTINFEVTATDGTNTETFTFAGVCLGWVVNPAVDDKNDIEFTIKISGSITRA